MTNLLMIEASPRGNISVSRHMAVEYIDEWQRANPNGKVIQRDLTNTPLKFTDAPWLTAYFTPPDKQSAEMKDALKLSDELVEELLGADVIVIGTPVYNYNVPAVLKAWFDHIVRKGMTLGFSGEGLLKGKRCTVLLASGGVYTEGSPIRDRDIATQWLRLILNVLGIEDIEFIAAGGTKVIDLGEQSRSEYMAPIIPLIREAVYP
ncbi:MULTISPECIES: FMN-dependent NADH-azoreductase [unclassified Pseudomonas]|uniref:FMN-dependent NADH-azoreductase n=1 Tax=unclassified Pseudomonas TaxID=196821 RepID=UPI000C2FA4F9|nr:MULTISPECIES: NAD(P)H-dependent oxidoreductase [unclassified Pseudomonas]MCU1740717.1 NAD(P)H-dependent oxidoreductase [Pseudomonas sp. 20S_6.2_Bac1]